MVVVLVLSTLAIVGLGARSSDLGFERRSAGAAVNWSRDWQASFPDELLERIEGLVDGS